MFTGYHCRPAVAEEAVRRCGVLLSDLADTLPAWEPRDLHLMVAHFLRLRFPILLALNKADVAGASDNVQKVCVG